MASIIPYLIRAYHDWMTDVGLTPNILVDCTNDAVVVPEQFIQQDKIVLNINASATDNLQIDNNAIHFKARFSGQSMDVFVPVEAVLSIYAQENGEGMFFQETEKPADKKPNLTLLD